MSRIQQVLQKAEREGTARRTRGIDGQDSRPIGGAPILIGPDEGLPLRVEVVDTPATVAASPLVARTTRSAQPHPLLVAAIAPHSPPAERYRSLRTRIAQIENGTLRRVLMMTSPGRGEGKSMTSVNLGVTMAQEFHRRVIVVDADLRRPTVHALLGIPLSPGLSDILLGGAALEDVIVTVPDYHLTVIPAGLPSEQPTELLGSTAMRTLLDQLRGRFDRVLLDTPPLAPLADAGVLVRLVDGVVLIVRADQTPRPAIEESLKDIETSKLLGLVLNDSSGPEPYSYPLNADDQKQAARKPRAWQVRDRQRPVARQE